MAFASASIGRSIKNAVLAVGLVGALVAAAGCIIIAGGDRGYSSSSWGEDLVSEVRTITVAHVANAPLDVRTQNGSVEVEQSGTDQVLVTATIRATSADRLAKTAVETNRAVDGTLLIRVQWPEGGRKSNEGVSFVVRTPGVGRTAIEASNGAIAIEGLSGDATLATSNGKISARRHDGFVKAATSNGAVTLRGVRGAKVDTSNASVTISLEENAVGPVNVDTSNGPITLEVGEGFKGRVAAKTSNGRVSNHVKRATAASADSKTSNEFEFGAGEQSSLCTSNGPVTIESR